MSVVAQLPLTAARAEPSARPLRPAEIAALTRLQTEGIVVVETQTSEGRRFRDAVHSLRERGFLIASSSDDRGYQLTTDTALLDATEADLRAKALSILRVYNRFRRSRQRLAA